MKLKTKIKRFDPNDRWQGSKEEGEALVESCGKLPDLFYETHPRESWISLANEVIQGDHSAYLQLQRIYRKNLSQFNSKYEEQFNAS